MSEYAGRQHQVAMLSLWRDDAATVEARASHLLGKTYGHMRWIWVVGDSNDDTFQRLWNVAVKCQKDIEIFRYDTLIAGEDPATRLRRLSVTANAGLDMVRKKDDYLLLHESDLRSPADLIERFLATGNCPIAGWVTLGEGGIFYDTFAYRQNGTMFSNYPPYHQCYWPDRLFEVESFGSCWMCHAEDIRARVRCNTRAVLDICQGLRERGRRLWVDPRITIVQPVELWESRIHA